STDQQFTIQQYFDWADDFLNRESIELIDKGDVDGISSLVFTLEKLYTIANVDLRLNGDERVKRSFVQRAFKQFADYLLEARKIVFKIADGKGVKLPLALKP